jgi:glycosyltransferase involved in cell wall biosynthesis
MRAVYASFDEVPSFKAASTHILANCRAIAGPYQLELITLGEVSLPSFAGFRHCPASFDEGNYLRRAERFRVRVRQRLQDDPPDLFHFRGPWEGLAADERAIPKIYEVNGLPSIELPYLYRDAGQRVLAQLREWEQRCLAGADAIVCPSERIRQCLLSRYRIPDPARIQVIPNGYDPVTVGSPHPVDGALRAVYLGTLHPWQGIHWALRAFASLGERYRLDIYGIGSRDWLRQAEKRIARHGLSNRVRLLPPLDRSRLSATLTGYHVGLAPLIKTERNAEQGCCPVKIMDYLAHGLVTVAPDLAVVRPMLRHGHNGWLYPPNCLNGLTATLEQLHQRRAELPALRRQVLESLGGLPTWAEAGRRLRRVYDALASARR